MKAFDKIDGGVLVFVCNYGNVRVSKSTFDAYEKAARSKHGRETRQSREKAKDKIELLCEVLDEFHFLTNKKRMPKL
jgi:hypothetical protein